MVIKQEARRFIAQEIGEECIVSTQEFCNLVSRLSSPIPSLSAFRKRLEDREKRTGKNFDVISPKSLGFQFSSYSANHNNGMTPTMALYRGSQVWEYVIKLKEEGKIKQDKLRKSKSTQNLLKRRLHITY